jgi:HSP20 family protein
MAYISFYNPYFFANRDENADSAYENLASRFNSDHCACKQVPAVNITETEKEYRIELALPGVDKELIRISHENGILNISVENQQKEENQQEEEDQETYQRREYDYSNATRRFKTGDRIDSENITAKYEQGILAVVLPKKEAYVKKPAQTIAVS